MLEQNLRLPFNVRAERKNGSVTYQCQTPTIALNKLLAFQQAQYVAITVMGPNGPLTETDLRRLVSDEAATAGGAPIDTGAPSAPLLVA